jgi:hypothetical protein
LQADLTAREQAIAAKEQDLAAREERLNAREKGFRPRVRLEMTLAAQALGFLLLFILGFGTFPPEQENIMRGYHFIQKIAWTYLGLSVGVFIILLIVAAVKKRITDGNVDFMLMSYVGIDILLLLLLVCQEGGLCRSMFLPVFFLIPTAYLIVERRESAYRWRRLAVLLVIIACICKSYKVSLEHQPLVDSTHLYPAEGTVGFLRWIMHITDFSTLSHWSYDHAVFYASLISAFIPVIQIIVEMLRDRIIDD